MSQLGKSSSLVRKQNDDHPAMAAPKSGVKSYRKRIANYEEANKYEAGRSEKYPKVTGNLMKEWSKIPPEKLRNLLSSLPERLKDVKGWKEFPTEC